LSDAFDSDFDFEPHHHPIPESPLDNRISQPYNRKSKATDKSPRPAPVGCYPVAPMGSFSILAKFFALAFSALLPLINPLGSALVLLGLVGDAPAPVFRDLARKIAIRTTLFLAVVELVGSALLEFFGISLPVIQVAGGLVLATMGWGLLNQNETKADPDRTAVAEASVGSLERRFSIR
jgi:hypothetical protein